MSRLISILMASTGLSEHDIRRIVANAPVRYKSYQIPKRAGGYRWISQPARELKALQYALVDLLQRELEIHPAATAYRSGVSIRDNARAHASNGPVLKFDFKDFFPSLRARDWRIYCEERKIFHDSADIELTAKVFFHQREGSSVLRLAIGAPSSPWLSNVLMCEFDKAVTEAVARDGVTYTRYADDLTFSGKRTGHLVNVERELRNIIKKTKSPSLTLNEKKTVLATRKFRRVVTGLVLTNEGSVSVGRERKRRARAGLHYAQSGRLSDDDFAKLAGHLSFIDNIEPGYLERITEKYGQQLLAQIFAAANRCRS